MSIYGSFNRRELMRLAGVGAASFTLRASTAGAQVCVDIQPRDLPAAFREKTVIFYYMCGGNDGLNTVIPTSTDEYKGYGDARKGLKIDKKNLAKKNGQPFEITDRQGKTFGFHPSLEPLIPLWEANEITLLQNVGYRAVGGSHFGNLDDWGTGLTFDQRQADMRAFRDRNADGLDGWVQRLYSTRCDGFGFPHISGTLPAGSPGGGCDALTLGSGFTGAPSLFRGLTIETLSLGSGGASASSSYEIKEKWLNGTVTSDPNALVMRDKFKLIAQQQRLLNSIDRSDLDSFKMTGNKYDDIGPIFGLLAKTLQANNTIPFAHISKVGFDTHRGQAGAQAGLLAQFANAVVKFKANVSEEQWNNTVIITYCEFGRTNYAVELDTNSGFGTDHGAANPHFVIGGGLNQGERFIGQFEMGATNLTPKLDFRSAFSAILEDFFELEAGSGAKLFRPQSFGQNDPKPAQYFTADEIRPAPIFRPASLRPHPTLLV